MTTSPASDLERNIKEIPTAFINIAYHETYEPQFLAIIATVALYGLVPTAAIDNGAANRLERILALIQSCVVSLHDLSWVFVDDMEPPTPRFNMPFELALAVATARTSRNSYYVLDTVSHRLDKTLSDLKGEDPLLHNGDPSTIFLAITNVFARDDFQPALQDFVTVFEALTAEADRLRRLGYKNVFQPATFNSLRRLAVREASRRRQQL